MFDITTVKLEMVDLAINVEGKAYATKRRLNTAQITAPDRWVDTNEHYYPFSRRKWPIQNTLLTIYQQW